MVHVLDSDIREDEDILATEREVEAAIVMVEEQQHHQLSLPPHSVPALDLNSGPNTLQHIEQVTHMLLVICGHFDNTGPQTVEYRIGY